MSTCTHNWIRLNVGLAILKVCKLCNKEEIEDK